MENKLKDKLESNENTIGCFVNFYSPSLVEIIGYSGYDFVVIDDEHGAFATPDLTEMIRAAKVTGITPIVRVSYNASSIQKALDQGAAGIQVPMVNNADDARNVVTKAKYPPFGTRGVAYSIPSAKYGKLNGRKYLNQANKNVIIVVHIETEEAVKNFEEIISVPEIDIAFIGTADLAVDMGYDDAHHEAVQETVALLFEKAKQYDIKMGLVASSQDGVTAAFEQGASYASVVANKVITNALKKLATIR